MRNIKNRVAALETASTNGPEVKTIIVRFFTAKGEQHELYELGRSLAESEERWSRLPGETEAEFTSRASREASRGGARIALLFERGKKE